MTKTFTPSDEQLAIADWVAEGTGHAIIDSVAGSGKTTTLEWLSREHLKGNIAILAFNKKIGNEIQTRLQDVPTIHAGTFHSAGLRAVQRARGRPRVDEDKVYNLIRAAESADGGFGFDAEELKASRLILARLVSYAKQAGLGIPDGLPMDESEIFLLGEYQDCFADAEVDPGRLARGALQLLKQSNMQTLNIDFDDMLYLPLLNNWSFNKFDWVLVDEAQDSNVVRRKIAQNMLGSSSRAIFVGDPHQAIYGFTGASSAALTLIAHDFRTITFRLSTCYRCAKSVIKEAQHLVPHIRWTADAPTGSVKTINLKNFRPEPGDMVLCRFNAPLIAQALRLVKQGKRVYVEGCDIGKNVLALAKKISGKGQNPRVELSEILQASGAFRARELKAATNSEVKQAAIIDRYDTLCSLIEGLIERGKTTLKDLADFIEMFFQDTLKAKETAIGFSTIHKAKGLEWPRVFLFGVNQHMPAFFATQDWMLEQEDNLLYVAITRAKIDLIYVDLPSSRRQQEGKVEEAMVED
jgi:superfamily I DNA/RNA helicase